MNAQQEATARECLTGSEENRMTFPEILHALGEAGFEGYTVDLRRATAAYFLPDGTSIELATHSDGIAVAARFDSPALQAAIREAQTLAPGYTYRGFCTKAKAAGIAGYVVSLAGRRALYIARTAETHVEHFPGST